MNENKKILITGGSGGIGTAICDLYQSKQFKLILTSSSDEKLQKLKLRYGENNHYYKLDLLDKENVENTTLDISKNHKDISIIINNAGLTKDSLLLRMKSNQWEDVITTNLSSNYYILKSLLPNMMSNKYGKVIGISSVIALTGNAGQSNYAASKSGLLGLYKSLALEFSKRNININVVSPGFIRSPMTDKLTENQKNEILSKIPSNRFGLPNDVANLVYFLSTDESSYITGQNFNINGGMLMP